MSPGIMLRAEAEEIVTPQIQAQLPSIQKLQLRGIQVGDDGFRLGINGSPQISASRLMSPDRIVLDLQGTEVVSAWNNAVLMVNRYGVRQIRVSQLQKSPAIARLVFELDGTSPVSWFSSFDAGLGLFLLRPTNLANVPSNQPISSSNPPVSTSSTTIEGLLFNGYGQLVIQANRAIAYRSNFDASNNTYLITIPSAQIAANLRRPVLGANSPIEQIRLNQSGNNVVVSIKTIAGWQLQETSRSNLAEIPLQLNSVSQVATNNGSLPQPTNNLPLRNNNRPIIAIDAGHGGRDVGATRNGIYEKDITLAISQQLGRILQQMGYGVVFTRTSDVEIDLPPRVKTAEDNRASVFVSVHVNSLDANLSNISGVETYYAPGSSLGKQLASLVHNQIIADTGASDRSIRTARFHVIVNTTMPAILVETGFITNPSEAANLTSASYQNRLANAIAKGVDRFLKSSPR
ncbi:MAG: N-acetylmuramoyl-L-alanine amidase [Pseudanabaenaceae cyanobacterium bins.39]|nr:N-acetylmuramoyl-L-alanine amidase [Pseudanabaenaceae cyanobacterium bins.39]